MKSFPLLKDDEERSICPEMTSQEPFRAGSCERMKALGVLLFLVLAGAWGIYQHRPPKASPATAPPDSFSADRAMADIRAFATAPRSAGTAAHAATRDFIVQAIESAGLQPELQDTLVYWRPGYGGKVTNVLARLPGTANSGAIALMAHYDSVSFGPGAADDGAGMATLLETMRALVAGPPLKNDVVFIFTDGEEGRLLGGTGCRGARAFVEQHPWAGDIAVILNFDCRGTSGPSYMYETTPGNSRLIAALAASGCSPMASSLMYDFYSRMPVDSDFTIFKKAGFTGLNFAFVDRLTHYHTHLDNPDNLNPDSVQHHGEYALRLTRYLGDISPADMSGRDVIYFNAIGYYLIHYPMGWVWPLNALAVALYAALLVFALSRGQARPRNILKAAVALLLTAAAAAGIVLAAVFIGYQARWVYLIYATTPLTWAALFFCIGAITTVSLRLLRGETVIAELALGGLLLWGITMIAVSAVMPGASYLLVWPMVFSLLGLAVLLLSRAGNAAVPAWVVVLLAASALPGILIVAGVLVGFHACLTVIFSPLLVLVGMGFLFTMLPLPALAAAPWPRLFPAVLMCLALILAVVGATAFPFSPERPMLNCVAYGLDAESGRAWWISSDKGIDAWTRQFFPENAERAPINEFYPHARDRYLKQSAPVAPLAPPVVSVIDDVIHNDTRSLRLRVLSPRQAPVLELYAAPGTRVLSAAVNGKTLQAVADGDWFLCFNTFPPDGVELLLDLPVAAPFSVTALDISYGLPEFPEHPFTPRPSVMIPKPNTVDFNKDPLKTDELFVRQRYTF